MASICNGGGGASAIIVENIWECINSKFLYIIFKINNKISKNGKNWWTNELSWKWTLWIGKSWEQRGNKNFKS